MQEAEDDEMLQELTSQAMRVNLFTPELPPVLLCNTKKNGYIFGHLPTSAVARDAKASGLQLIDNQCYQDEPFAEDCVMSAMDEHELLIPGSNLGGVQHFAAINQQISQLIQPALA